MKEYIDWSVFLGMHHRQEDKRIACKNFFVERLHRELHMSLESVGKCDDVIWQFGHQQQSAYYPFMDRLHTEMRIHRTAYSASQLRAFQANPSHGCFETMTLMHSRDGMLYTLNDNLIKHANGAAKQVPMVNAELSFPPLLEALYQTSLALRI